MRKAQPTQKEQFPQPDTITKIVPSPTDGWDALSPLASMDPKRAPILQNWVPRPGWVELRGGYNIWNTTGATYLTGSPVESLVCYRALGAEQLFAASGGVIYNVSTQFAATPVVTGLVSNRWQYVNFTPALGNTVIQLCNGTDQLQMFNGTTWTVPSITGLPGGVGTTAIRNIACQKRRVWFCLNSGSGSGTTVAAFMPTDAITGPIAGTLDLGALWNKGGFLQAIANWTVDGGSGPNDYACFISNKGQISIYQGTDPTNANAWALVGTFDIAPPIGDRCVCRIGSDVGIITLQGVIPISTALPFDPSADRSVAITSRIQNQMFQAANSFSGNFGWQLITYPLQTLLVLNVPQATNSSQTQYVMNTLTGAWCQFTGWNANVFEIYNNNLYFGDNTGNVALAYQGGSDLFNAIAADMQCAFNYFDDPGRTKRMTMVQPLFVASGNITVNISVDVSFQSSTTSAPVTFTASGALWGAGAWTTSSTTSNTLAGTGQVTFTVGAGLPITTNQVCAATANNTNTIFGTVASYSGTTLVINATSSQGTPGTYNGWVISGDTSNTIAGAGTWDMSVWQGGLTYETNYFSVNALGHALAVRLKVTYFAGNSTAAQNGVFDIGQFDNATFDSGLSGANAVLQVIAFNAILEMGGYLT